MRPRVLSGPPARWSVVALLGLSVTALASAGCAGRAPAKGNDREVEVPVVKTVHPRWQSLTRVVEQPGRLEPYEQAPLFAKVSGFVEKVNVDIGAEVRKGQVLVELSIPEMEREIQQKQAAVGQAHAEIDQADKAVTAAEASVETAQSLVEEARFAVQRAQAERERSQSEYARMEKLARNKVIDGQARDEALNQMKSAEAVFGLTNAKIQSAEANLRELKAKLGKSQADAAAARSRLRFAEADQARIEAWFAYAKIRAPFDGVVSERHVDPGHFLQPGMSGGANKTDPLLVVVRTDIVRVFVDVPESDAVGVKNGTPATIHIQSLGEAAIEDQVVGSSFSLNPSQRTLCAEIDLKNPKRQLRPGMYAYAILTVQRPKVATLPVGAIVMSDNQALCFMVENGKAVRTPIRIGYRDSGVVEVLKKQVIRTGGEKRWQDFTGQEEIVVTDPKNLIDGQSVETAE